MPDFLSLGIPAYNEEESIERMLSSVFKSTLWRQTPPGMREVMVCCNGCTDKTEEIVRKISAQHLNGELKVMASAPGKVNAWNALVKRMDRRAKVLFFADADVLVHRTAFENLRNAFSGKIVIAASRVVPVGKPKSIVLRGMGRLEKKAAVPELPEVIGMLYGIRRDFAESVKMPHNIINDDGFLEAVAGKERTAFVSSAKVYYQPARTLRDWIKQKTRVYAGRRQLFEMGLTKVLPGSWTNQESRRSLREWISYFRKLSRAEKMYAIAKTPLEQIPFALSKRYLRKRKTQGWAKIKSSKFRPKIRPPV
ncbi:MAG: glycosyltransferase [Candidatus Diapherotrites archaeon]|nr:glycosyltransferase [Candidatus Diapherotrites archaeon]